MKVHITMRTLDIHLDVKKNEQLALPDLATKLKLNKTIREKT